MQPTRDLLKGHRNHGTPLFPWDHYFTTMAEGDVALGRGEELAVKSWFVRKGPSDSPFLFFGGLSRCLQVFQDLRTDTPVFLRGMREMGAGRPLLEYLREHKRLSLRVYAPPEGSVFVPHEPVVTLEGPLPFMRLAEGILITECNFPSLQMTVAHRVLRAGLPGAVLEFGRRRAQDPYRSTLYSYMAGIPLTSNDEIREIWDIPVTGTMGHEWIQGFGKSHLYRCEKYTQYFTDHNEYKTWVRQFGSELASFDAWLEAHPDKPILLVDTINTLQSGIPNAILAFKHHQERIKKAGGIPGVRLDSGRLGWLALAAVKMLNQAHLSEARIVLSGDLDEFRMQQIKQEIRDQAKEFGLEAEKVISRIIWGVGTRLVTCANDPSLNAAAKLMAVSDFATIKISDTAIKSSIPGNNRSAWICVGDELLCVLVYSVRDHEVRNGELVDRRTGKIVETLVVYDKDEGYKSLRIPPGYRAEPRQRLVFDSISGGGILWKNLGQKTLDYVITHVRKEVSRLHPATLTLHNPWPIKLSLTPELSELRQTMMKARVLREDLLCL
ncbi:MAG: hypothetical protein FJ044_01835 [Candidatus Cloacimonetes bacterium]|nr:hypothetical protein [Candidatus Cloacimonadota bacterium]